MRGIARELEAALIQAEGRMLFGELLLLRESATGYSVRHVLDEGETTLEKLGSLQEVRTLGKYTAEGQYRPLKTAPTLKRGWYVEASDARQLLACLDAIYPAVMATSLAYFQGALSTVPLRVTLARQSGMYRRTNAISDEVAVEIQRDFCQRQCLRTIAWPVDPASEMVVRAEAGQRLPMICSEACTFVVNEARVRGRK